MKEGEKERGKNSWNHVISVNFEWFPANPSQILPAFCHGNEVKPWKFEKKITKIIVRLTRERKKGRKKKIWKKFGKFLKKIFEIFFFPKFQKRSKKVEKMILSPMEVVSEGGNRGKVAKKEK